MLLFLSVADGCLIAVYILKSVLVLHELAVVLLVNRVLLGLDLVPQQHFFVVFVLLPLSLLLLSSFYVLSYCQLFKSLPFLFLHQLSPAYVVLF